MDPGDLCYCTLEHLATLIRRREVSSVEATRAVLERVDRLDGRLNSFITVLRDQSLAQARAADEDIRGGRYRGPLHGIPIAVKDLCYTEGVPTTGGSKVLASFVPTHDATVVTRLREAGAVLVGKLNMHEFARGATNTSSLVGPCHNPWDAERVSGGSSGGSGAAVAAGLCFAALGSDTGGSIRIPAALCGIVGLKPTYGRVSRHGVLPLSWTLDHVGPMTRTARDAALVLSVIAGHDRRDVTTRTAPVPDYAAAVTGEVKGVRLGVPRDFFFEDIDPDVATAVRHALRALEGLGARIEEVSMPLVRYAPSAGRVIALTEAAAVHERHLRLHAGDYAPDVRAASLLGQLVLGKHYLKAQRVRSLIRREMAEALQRADVLVAPAVPIPAPRIEAVVGADPESKRVAGALSRLSRPANLTGVPAMSVPCGFTPTGLPVGLQLMGRPFAEATLLNIAHAYGEEAGWRRRHPLA
jgi:aspartyl-tRNA(Asn)/glutamyl-tRNA(Gln) amidotransferase subunit A